MNILRFLIPKSAVEYIHDTSTVRQALEKMRYHHYVAIPVLDSEGRYVGTLKNDDIFKYFVGNGRFRAEDAEHDNVMKIIDLNYCRPLRHSADMNELFDMVKEHNLVPVIDDRSCFIGLVLRRDVLEFLQSYYNETINK